MQMDRQKKNILIVENALGITGSLKAIALNAHDLADEFNFSFAIPTTSSNGQWLEEQGFSVHKLPFMELRKIREGLAQLLLAITTHVDAASSLGKRKRH